jgi:BNR/Asp-box repeat
LNDKRLDTFLMKNDFPEKYNDSTVKELVREDKINPTDIYDYLNDANAEMYNSPVIGCEVYRSDNGGLTWKKVNTKGLNLYGTYGYYFGKISVSPVNDNKVIINGINAMLSVDGGKTFKPVDKSNTHGDWHGEWMDPKRDSHWIAGNDGGCNLTYDNGAHWFKANTPPVAQFYSVTVDNAKPYHIYGGIQDNGIWYGSSQEDDQGDDDDNLSVNENWKILGGGDGMRVQVDTRDNKTVYFGSQFGEYVRKTIGDDKTKRIHPMPDIASEKYRYNWETPILLSSFNQDILYMGSDVFYRSMDEGKTMTSMSKDLTNGKRPGNVPFGTIVTISESPLRFGLIYVGTDDGNIQVTKDGGYTWTLVSGKLPRELYVSRVVASAYKEGRVFATLNGYRNDNFTPWLYVSDDYGQTWTRIGNNLPAGPLNVVREDPKVEDIIYVGSDNGLYASFDMGKTFMALGDLPSVPVHDIAVQKRDNDIIVATHGRSIYVTSLDNVQKKFVENSQKQMARSK